MDSRRANRTLDHEEPEKAGDEEFQMESSEQDADILISFEETQQPEQVR